jgi:hypothetical protein
VIVGTRAMNRQPVGREKLETDTACNNQ